MLLFEFFGSRNLIVIHTDKPSYYAGDRVTGTVSLSVVEPLHLDAVFLRVNGYEMTDVPYQKAYQEYDLNTKQMVTRFREERTSQTNKFYSRNFCLYSSKSTLGFGNFVFPFEFVLDGSLPGTFYLKDGKAKGEVVYKVAAEVVVPGFFTSNLRHEQEIVIKEPLKQALGGTETFKETDVTFLCCINKGRVAMSANVDKNAAAPGEAINLHIVVDNSRSQVDLKEVRFHLCRSIKFKANGQKWTDYSTIMTSTSPQVLQGTNADRWIAVRIPNSTMPSTDSSLITCEYSLTVELSVPWSPNVRINLPLQVYAPTPVGYVSVVQYPANWTATTMDTAQLSQSVSSPQPPPSASPSPQPQQYQQPSPQQQQYQPQQQQQYQPQQQQQQQYQPQQQQQYQQSPQQQYQQSPQQQQYQQPSPQQQQYQPQQQQYQPQQQQYQPPSPAPSFNNQQQQQPVQYQQQQQPMQQQPPQQQQ